MHCLHLSYKTSRNFQIQYDEIVLLIYLCEIYQIYTCMLFVDIIKYIYKKVFFFFNYIYITAQLFNYITTIISVRERRHLPLLNYLFHVISRVRCP